MAEDHRLLGKLDRFHRRAVTGVGQVDDYTKLVHALDGLLGEGSQAGIDFGGIAAAIIAVLVESEGETAQAEVEERVQQAQAIGEWLGILQTEQHPDFASILFTIQIGGAPQNISMGMIAYDRFDCLEVFDAFQSIVPGQIGGAADHFDALTAQLIEKRRREILRPGRTETIDDASVRRNRIHINAASSLERAILSTPNGNLNFLQVDQVFFEN